MSSQMVFRPGPRYKFRRQEFWAEGGLVCIENQDNGDVKIITRAEAAARAIALNAELQYIDYPSERDELSKCVVDLCEVVKEAKRQGDPSDPEVRRQRIKDLRKVSFLRSRETPTPDIAPPSIITTGAGNPFTTATSIGQSNRFTKLRI